jgi:hypothetical protein
VCAPHTLKERAEGASRGGGGVAWQHAPPAPGDTVKLRGSPQRVRPPSGSPTRRPRPG